MLGGIDPVIIFEFSKKIELAGPTIPGQPILEREATFIENPPIPIYLSETLFNIVIDGESKNVDIETNTETLTDGAPPQISQKGVQSGITIEIEGKKDSVALILLSSMIDVVFDKVTSKEYTITYLHGPITIFRGLLNSFSMEVVQGTDKLAVKIGITKGKNNPSKTAGVPSVPGDPGIIPGG